MTTVACRQAGRERARRVRAERHVLHQGDVGESTGRPEGVAGDEDRLVTGGDAAQPRAQVHRALDDTQHRMRAVEPHVEPAPFAASGAGGVADRPVPAGGKPRVRVQEQQHPAARGPGAGIHLACTAARRIDEPIAQGAGDAPGFVPAAPVGHDHLDAVAAQGL